MSDFLQQHYSINSFKNSDNWVLLNRIESSIKEKIEKYGIPLSKWNVSINYGIKTGYNDAFIIDEATKNTLITSDPKSAELIRPFNKYDIAIGLFYAVGIFIGIGIFFVGGLMTMSGTGWGASLFGGFCFALVFGLICHAIITLKRHD